jgi:hypothetical protein
MKLKEIGAPVFETTSAGSIASVASSLFTPTSDGRPAVIRRTKKKQNKNPSIYEGDMKTDREAGIKWVDNPEWEQLHNMDLDMVKDFLEHKEGVSEAVGDSAEALYKLQDELGLEDNILVDELARYLDVDQIADFVAHFRRHHEMNYSNNDEGIAEQPDQKTTQQVTQRAAQLKTVGGGKASASMVAKGLDKVSQGGTMPPILVKAIAPYAQAIQKMMADPQLFTRFKMLMKQANAGTAGTAVGRKLGESLTRQHFEMFANVLRDIENRDKREDHAEFLIRVFKQDNEKFDIQRFLKAANLVTEKAPPGREKQVKALKGKVDNPYAVSWASYNKSKGKK